MARLPGSGLPTGERTLWWKEPSRKESQKTQLWALGGCELAIGPWHVTNTYLKKDERIGQDDP